MSFAFSSFLQTLDDKKRQAIHVVLYGNFCKYNNSLQQFLSSRNMYHCIILHHQTIINMTNDTPPKI